MNATSATSPTRATHARASPAPATPFPLRLHPGDDLRRALQAVPAAHGVGAAFVLAGIGSLRPAALRLAGAEVPLQIDADCEILTLSGSLGPDGAHLHMSLADDQGRVLGGHVSEGCIVRTTAEVLLMLLPAWHFTRAHDAATGWPELVVGPAAGAAR